MLPSLDNPEVHLYTYSALNVHSLRRIFLRVCIKKNTPQVYGYHLYQPLYSRPSSYERVCGGEGVR
jgi:hypothetical protein